MEDKHEMYRASVSLHKERVNKNPSRMEYVIKKFEEYGIKYELKNEENCHFHVWRKSDEELFEFWAGTGKIKGTEVRGINNLIEILLA
ncbi:hypothetical protein MCI89_14205 [Muricomes sp. OA1]|uniref:hypothetical protein n=1 Tax=Muricomes sp. OA1 TaxID=2914165 RepID=UPI001F064FC2|nr:hypothetical protein [Muricomes sp. OA1]MCH1973497.1 hypothetical protein [Muricomes sp. OA1]